MGKQSVSHEVPVKNPATQPKPTVTSNTSTATAPVNNKNNDAPKSLQAIQTVSLRKKAAPAATVRKQTEEEHFVVNQPFTKEALQLAWKQYVENIEEDLHLAKAMNNMPLEILEDYQLEALVQNQALEAKLIAIKGTLEKHLRRQLKNGKIQLLIRMSSVTDPSRPFTNKEKLDFMIQKNPHLETLYRSLNMDF